MILDVIRVTAGIIFLGYASFSDLKTRRVDDKIWVIMGFIGFLILIGQFCSEKMDPVYYLIFIPIMLLFFSCFLETGEKTNLLQGRIKKEIWFPLCVFGIIVFIYLAYRFQVHYYLVVVFILLLFFSFFLEAEEKTDLRKGEINRKIWASLCVFEIIVFIYLVYRFGLDYLLLKLITIPLFMLFVFILYNLRLLFGGADAKALITIALLTPFYPNWTPFLRYFIVKDVWPFPIIVLTNALILSLTIPIAFLIYNASRKDFHFPLSFLGYKMDIDSVEKKFVWPLEKVKNEKIVKVFLPKKDENTKEEIQRLKAVGAKRIWVTSKIPFMLPLSAGFITSFLAGDIMFRIVRMIWGI
ncbi:MAG: A24 family peptidase C-terminal domain-containing protein [Thermoplasmatales archaeon]|nr:A24 family peptidase C-terminal domain-containing protein [Thermoplasmatales archaeon]